MMDDLSTTEERLKTTQMEISSWTAQQFERLVLDSNPKVRSSTAMELSGAGSRLRFPLLVARAGPGFALRQRLDRYRYRAYKAGKVSEVAICGEMVQIYAGLRDGELRAARLNTSRDSCDPVIP